MLFYRRLKIKMETLRLLITDVLYCVSITFSTDYKAIAVPRGLIIYVEENVRKS